MPASAPSFLAHQGRQTVPVLGRFLGDLGQLGSIPRVGATVFLPRYIETTCADYLAALSVDAAFVLADPETHRLELPFDERGRGRRSHAYLQESDPVANRSRFVENVLRAQVNAGADALISPWLTHGATATTRNFRATIRFAEEAAGHSLVQSRTLLLGLAATEDIVADDEARDDLLDAIVELPEGHVYFRIRVTPPSSYAQYANRVALRGLRRFVEGLAANGRQTILPQVGLAGWLLAPYGAISFGSGISASMQRFIAPSDGFGRPLEWYFVPQLLTFVLRTEMQAIRQLPTYVPCQCPYCPSLPFGPGTWNSVDAGLHYLWSCAQLMQEVAAPRLTGEQAVRDRIEAARAFWSELEQAAISLDPRSEPRHLEAWSAVVA